MSTHFDHHRACLLKPLISNTIFEQLFFCSDDDNVITRFLPLVEQAEEQIGACCRLPLERIYFSKVTILSRIGLLIVHIV